MTALTVICAYLGISFLVVYVAARVMGDEANGTLAPLFLLWPGALALVLFAGPLLLLGACAEVLGMWHAAARQDDAGQIQAGGGQ